MINYKIIIRFFFLVFFLIVPFIITYILTIQFQITKFDNKECSIDELITNKKINETMSKLEILGVPKSLIKYNISINKNPFFEVFGENVLTNSTSSFLFFDLEFNNFRWATSSGSKLIPAFFNNYKCEVKYKLSDFSFLIIYIFLLYLEYNFLASSKGIYNLIIRGRL